MFNRKLVITTLILGLFSTGLIAKDKDYVEAKKPSKTLVKADLDIIEKAKSKNFKGLTTKDKEKLLQFLEDYMASAKKEKVKKDKVVPPKDDKKKDKKIKKDAKPIKVKK